MNASGKKKIILFLIYNLYIDAQNLTTFLKETLVFEFCINPHTIFNLPDFIRQPPLVQINIIVTSLFQILESKNEYSVLNFIKALRYAYDLIKEWKSIKSAFYKKALSEILLIIDEYFDEIRDNKEMK